MYHEKGDKNVVYDIAVLSDWWFVSSQLSIPTLAGPVDEDAVNKTKNPLAEQFPVPRQLRSGKSMGISLAPLPKCCCFCCWGYTKGPFYRL